LLSFLPEGEIFLIFKVSQSLKLLRNDSLFVNEEFSFRH